MNTIRRLFVILLVALTPVAFLMALMPDALLFMVTHATLSRFLRRLPRVLDPIGFGVWTVLLGVIIHSCVCWWKNPQLRNFFYMLLSFFVLGSALILFLRMAFFFSMPGGGY